MNAVAWRVGWNGQGLTRLSSVRQYYNYWNPPGAARPAVFFDVSPDGRHLAFNTQEVLQANIGMLESVR